MGDLQPQALTGIPKYSILPPGEPFQAMLWRLPPACKGTKGSMASSLYPWRQPNSDFLILQVRLALSRPQGRHGMRTLLVPE